jgi:penicillin-binding protein 1C
VGVWVGNFSGIGVPELSGANTATPLLFRIFNTIDYDSNTDWYAPPANCELRKVCSETGLSPGPNCSQQISDYFIPLVSTTTVCQHMIVVKVSPDSSISYCESCAPSTGYIKKLYRNISPEMQEYYSNNDISFQKIPPHNPDCEKIFRGDGPAITSPLNGTEYFISKKDPEPLQLTASAGSDVSRIYWYINDEFYKTTRVGEKQFFIPKAGPVKISCTDDKGRNRNIRIMVKYVDL